MRGESKPAVAAASRLALLLCGTVSVLAPAAAWAHALAGMRVFPATLSFDDPGVVDEMPFVARAAPHGDNDGVGLTGGISKTLTDRIGLSVTAGFAHYPASGWNDVTVAGSYELLVHPQRESIAMVQLAHSIGGSGGRVVGSPYSVTTPEFAFGQGFGTVPHALRDLRPLAITGAISEDLPSDHSAPRVLHWNLSFQYSLPYLENFVRDTGLKAPWRNVVPLVELPLQTCVAGPCAGTTGTINPGAIWIGHDYQVGLEAEIPINRASGRGLGVLLGIDFYLDDLSPRGFGQPLFGRHS